MTNNKWAVLLVTLFSLAAAQAQVKYLDCGIDFSCPYFGG